LPFRHIFVLEISALATARRKGIRDHPEFRAAGPCCGSLSSTFLA
jgi:hypothetical protein